MNKNSLESLNVSITVKHHLMLDDLSVSICIWETVYGICVHYMNLIENLGTALFWFIPNLPTKCLRVLHRYGPRRSSQPTSASRMAPPLSTAAWSYTPAPRLLHLMPSSRKFVLVIHLVPAV